MSVVTVFSVLLVVGVLLFGSAWIVKYLSTPSSIGRSEKRELKELRMLVQRIDRLAYTNRDINPELSVQILDEISQHKNKELGS